MVNPSAPGGIGAQKDENKGRNDKKTPPVIGGEDGGGTAAVPLCFVSAVPSCAVDCDIPLVGVKGTSPSSPRRVPPPILTKSLDLNYC